MPLNKPLESASKSEVAEFADELGVVYDTEKDTKAEILLAIEKLIGPYDPEFHPVNVEGTAEWDYAHKHDPKPVKTVKVAKGDATKGTKDPEAEADGTVEAKKPVTGHAEFNKDDGVKVTHEFKSAPDAAEAKKQNPADAGGN